MPKCTTPVLPDNFVINQRREVYLGEDEILASDSRHERVITLVLGTGHKEVPLFILIFFLLVIATLKLHFEDCNDSDEDDDGSCDDVKVCHCSLFLCVITLITLHSSTRPL